jgi:lipopolysaccharide export system permease protein
MRILTRYILFDLLRVFLLTLAGMTLLIFIALIGKEAVDKGLGLGPLLQMLPYLLPQAMQFAIPGTMLLATTSVYGRMSAFNEVLAIKSSGISPWAIVWPTLTLATIVSLGAVLMNDLAVSWGRLGVQRVFIESLEEVVYGRLNTTRTYSDGKLKITVKYVDGRKLIEPILEVRDKQGGGSLSIAAEEAELHSDPAEAKLVIRLTNFQADGSVKVSHPRTYEHVIALDDLSSTSSKNRSPSSFALAEIPPALETQQKRIKNLEQEIAAGATFALLTGEFDDLSAAAWQPYETERRSLQSTLDRLYTEPVRRWANGFSCLCFVLVGIPMAIIRQKGEFLASFFICFAPILLVYYPLLMFSVDQAKDGALPPITVWLGNAVLACWGLWMMRRVVRY